jgi:hypothetical protein
MKTEIKTIHWVERGTNRETKDTLGWIAIAFQHKNYLGKVILKDAVARAAFVELNKKNLLNTIDLFRYNKSELEAPCSIAFTFNSEPKLVTRRFNGATEIYYRFYANSFNLED